MNQNIKEKIEETSKLKQIKRVLHKIQNQTNWKKKKSRPSGTRASKTTAAKVKQRICYCCRKKGHLAKDCPLMSNYGSPGPSNSEPVVVNSICGVRNPIPTSVSDFSTNVSALGTSAQFPSNQSFCVNSEERLNSWLPSVLLFWFLWDLIANVEMFEQTFPP